MRIVKNFPPAERYSLTDNMTRAARSVTQNIAEGRMLINKTLALLNGYINDLSRAKLEVIPNTI